MSRRSILVGIVILAFAVAGSALWYFVTVVLQRHAPEDLWTAPTVLRRARALSLDDVDKVVIMIEGDGTAVLYPEKDAEDIRAILNSVKGMRVAKSEVSVNNIDLLRVYSSRKGGFNLYGRFDPARAPIVSPAMRSDNLSSVLTDIARQKALKPN